MVEDTIYVKFAAYNDKAANNLGFFLKALSIHYNGEIKGALSDDKSSIFEIYMRPEAENQIQCLKDSLVFLNPEFELAGNQGHAVQMLEIRLDGPSFNPALAEVVNSLSRSLASCRSAIIGAYASNAALSKRVDDLQGKVESLTIYNAEVINGRSVIQAIITLAEKSGLSVDDLFPPKFVRTH